MDKKNYQLLGGSLALGGLLMYYLYSKTASPANTKSAQDELSTGNDIEANQNAKLKSIVKRMTLEMQELARKTMIDITKLLSEQYQGKLTQDSLSMEITKIQQHLLNNAENVEDLILEKQGMTKDEFIEATNKDEELLKEISKLHTFFAQAQQAIEPQFTTEDNMDELFNQVPKEANQHRYCQVVKAFYEHVNTRVTMEVMTMLLYDFNAVINDQQNILRMTIQKVNMCLKEWQQQLWKMVLKRDNVRITEDQSQAIHVLYHDIEKQYITKQKETTTAMISTEMDTHRSQIKHIDKVVKEQQMKAEGQEKLSEDQEQVLKQQGAGDQVDFFNECLAKQTGEIDFESAEYQIIGLIFEQSKINKINGQVKFENKKGKGFFTFENNAQQMSVEKISREKSLYDVRINLKKGDLLICLEGIYKNGQVTGAWEQNGKSEYFYLSFTK